MDNWERVAKEVRARRAALGLTQQEAAASANVSEATWNLIENARGGPYKPRSLRGICSALRWTSNSIDRLLHDKDVEEIDSSDTPSDDERIEQLEERIAHLERALGKLRNAL